MFRRIAQWLFNLPVQVVSGERWWGLVRLVLVLPLLFCCAWLGRLAFTEPGVPPASAFSAQGLRNLLFPAAAFVGAWLIAMNYVRILYSLPSYRMAFRWLFASIFNLGVPSLEISNGRLGLEEDELNLMVIIGGPGSLQIRPGSAVVLEQLERPSNVYGVGRHAVSRLEKIRENTSLEEQEGEIESLLATTKDGIEVTVRNIRYRYRVINRRLPNERGKRSPTEPYPVLVQAMLNMAYQRTISSEGVTPWPIAVRLAIEGVIGEFVRQHKFDQLKRPSFIQEDPRQEIARRMRDRNLRQRLRDLGAELIWFDIGHFDPVDPEVNRQFVQTWEAFWQGSADVTRAYAEARHLASQEQGRAEAQAEILLTIVDTLREYITSDADREKLQNLIIMRTAQILDALAEQGQPPYPHELPPAKPKKVEGQ